MRLIAVTLIATLVGLGVLTAEIGGEAWWLILAVSIAVVIIGWALVCRRTAAPRRQAFGPIAAVGLLVAGSVVGFVGPEPAPSAQTQRREAIMAAASDATTSLMTFSPATRTSQQPIVTGKLTGGLLLDYRGLGVNVVLPSAIETQASMTATVVASAVARADSDTARVLLYIDQQISLPMVASSAERTSIVRWATLHRVDGRWLLAGLDAVGSAN